MNPSTTWDEFDYPGCILAVIRIAFFLIFPTDEDSLTGLFYVSFV